MKMTARLQMLELQQPVGWLLKRQFQSPITVGGQLWFAGGENTQNDTCGNRFGVEFIGNNCCQNIVTWTHTLLCVVEMSSHFQATI